MELGLHKGGSDSKAFLSRFPQGVLLLSIVSEMLKELYAVFEYKGHIPAVLLVAR